MTLDDTDKALVAAAHARPDDHLPLLVLADKKEEEGHEDFAHLLRTGVTHGRADKWRAKDTSVTKGWYPGSSQVNDPQRLLLTLSHPEGTGVTLQVPTHHPEIREMASRHSGTPAPDGEHWQGENPLYLTTPEELDSLRAAHGYKPATPPHLSVHHGPGGMFGVLAPARSNLSYNIRRLAPTGAYNGIEDGGRAGILHFPTQDAAAEHAHHLANPERPEKLSRAAQTQSGNMRARLKLAAHILAEAGVQGTPLPVLAHDAALGTRPDVMVASDTHIHPAVLRYLAAHHGLLNQTPNVIAFNAHPSGRDRVHVIQSGLERQQAMRVLQQAGLPKFTMHTSTVYLFDEGSQLDLTPLLRGLNASSYHAVAGIGHVVGAGEGADAGDQRAHYRDAIRAAESAAESGGTESPPSSGVKRLSRDKPPVTYGRHVFTPHPSLVDALAKSPVSSDEVMTGLHASIPHDQHPMHRWFAGARYDPPTIRNVSHDPHDTNDSDAWQKVFDEMKAKGVSGYEALGAADHVTSQNDGTMSLHEGGGFFSVRDPNGGFHHIHVAAYVPDGKRGLAEAQRDAMHRLHVGQLRKKLNLSRAEAALVTDLHRQHRLRLADKLEAAGQHHDQETLTHLRDLDTPVSVGRHPDTGKVGAWPKKESVDHPDNPGYDHKFAGPNGTWVIRDYTSEGMQVVYHLQGGNRYRVMATMHDPDRARRYAVYHAFDGRQTERLSRADADTLREDSPRGILYDWLQENPHRLHGFAESGLTEPADHPMMRLLSGSDAVHVAKHPDSGNLVVWPSHGYEKPIRGVTDLNARRVWAGMSLLGEGCFHAAEGHGGIYTARRSYLDDRRGFAVDAHGPRGDRLDSPAPTFHPTHEAAVAEANRLAWSTLDGK